MAGVPVGVELGGATEFALEVGDAGDGIACDQADWAEAQAVLNDGTVVRLGDLPFLEQDAGATADPPFSFVYDGRSSTGLLAEWGAKRDRRQLDDQRSEYTLTYTDPKTGLVVRAVGIEYHDFPTVEWTLYFSNTGTVDTPLLTDIQAIDTWFRRGRDGEFTLHHNTGSPAAPNDYEPHATPLRPRTTQRIATSGGRSTNSNMPYFNVRWPGQGVIVVLGWPGQWAAEFSRDDGTGLRVRGGQELTRFKLQPGEEVRTPLVVVQFWNGDVRLGTQSLEALLRTLACDELYRATRSRASGNPVPKGTLGTRGKHPVPKATLGTRGKREAYCLAPRIHASPAPSNGLGVCHCPRVKSGTFTGELPLATDATLSGKTLDQAAASYTVMSSGLPACRQWISRQFIR